MQFENNSGRCISDDADSFWKMEDLGNTWRDFARHALNGTSRADEPIDRGGFSSDQLALEDIYFCSRFMLVEGGFDPKKDGPKVRSNLRSSSPSCLVSSPITLRPFCRCCISWSLIVWPLSANDKMHIPFIWGLERKRFGCASRMEGATEPGMMSFLTSGGSCLETSMKSLIIYLGNSTRQWIFDRRHHWDRQNPNPEERLVQSSNLGKMSQVSVQLPIIGGFKPMFFVHPGRSWTALDFKHLQTVFFKWVAWKTNT